MRTLLIALHLTLMFLGGLSLKKSGTGWREMEQAHVATLSLHSLFELRACMEKGSIMLDREASSLRSW